MSVLGSEDEIEELASELVDVAKVNRSTMFSPQTLGLCLTFEPGGLADRRL